ncbi:ATPase [Clostridium sp. AF18-27]|uniref:V/A-type H+-transporting ATPase subunit I n=1 Tax=Enterocloster lavalensis TaxID=460384 RepID=A0A1I0K3R6_9FIRM|nr:MULTISPECIES: V-type ATPase 116kDa subunit family protein [Enterocloster]RHR45097.1 ATPase [Clostridium sp. AF18-27]MCB6342506.1 ATPase [Enterocloster lavalensis]MDR3759899.1 V-type ATPase 116kDa subunit family protein [Enterocloster sp.]PST31646.1 ATPase [Enterocloster lavalensis]SEU18322.1 V/A-type H+-transporting ATPase subunit I [Enterocloster lavalensis]
MIEKMKFLSITGPKADIDRVVDTYLSRYEIHLENALSELKTVRDLRPYIETNPYKEELLKAQAMMESYHELLPGGSERRVSLETALETVRSLDRKLSELTEQKNELLAQRAALQESMDKVVPFSGLNYDVRRILGFQYIKFRFGRISREYYEKFSAYVYDTIDTILFKCKEDAQYIWIVYFVPEKLEDKIDAIYASMHFERMFLPDEYDGTPTQAGHNLEDQIRELEAKILQVDQDIVAAINSRKDDLIASYQRISTFSTNFDVRKLAACTKHDDHTFYILCGWMTEQDARSFQKEIENDDNTFCIIEDDHANIMSKPPTKMKNPGLFKPFELYVEMYGLPSYNEIDPTILIGLTYSFLFGFMFGDAGQGLCLLIGGFLLYRFKKVRLAGIISCCGVFSTIFGLLFGSVFGFEDLIPAMWLRPSEAMTNLPFIGKLNTVFVVAVGLGMLIILMCMVLNIVNSLRSHDTEKVYFDTNGVAGLVFYFALACTIVLYMSGKALPATVILVVMFVVPLFVMFFKEPLTAIVEKKAEKIEGGVGMFITQGLFELFEVLLSYFSNTLSFVRVGAFAVSHAAMMQVVLMLAGAEAGSPNWAVVIGGNLFVCGMEGLIVGIQVLRLEYYELFSRFYRGSGRAFKPYGKAAEQQ